MYDSPDVFVGMALFMGFLVVAVAIVVMVFYLLTLQRTFEACSPENCEMNPPGLVWLNFIPLFNLGWTFVIVIKLANSIRKEYAALGIQGECSGGFGVGLAYAICSVCGIIPVLGLFAGIGALVCWIIHWVQISGFRRVILHHRAQAQGNPSSY